METEPIREASLFAKAHFLCDTTLKLCENEIYSMCMQSSVLLLVQTGQVLIKLCPQCTD